MSDTPETIYLIPDASEGVLGHVWCDDPAPGIGMDPEDAIEYRRADTVDDELTAAKARIAELEKALEPLADIVTAFDEKYYDHHQQLVLMEAGDARRAAALLKESTND